MTDFDDDLCRKSEDNVPLTLKNVLGRQHRHVIPILVVSKKALALHSTIQVCLEFDYTLALCLFTLLYFKA